MRKPDRVIASLVRERFLVTLTDGSVFAGLLWDADPTTLHLKDPEAVGADGTRVKADSDVFLPRARVAYLQLID